MFYYAVIQNKKDGTMPMSIVAKESEDDARKQMNYDMWYVLDQKDQFNSILCLVINEIGNVIRMDRYPDRAMYIPEPEPIIEEPPIDETGDDI